jgi:hypothetical protein
MDDKIEKDLPSGLILTGLVGLQSGETVEIRIGLPVRIGAECASTVVIPGFSRNPVIRGEDALSTLINALEFTRQLLDPPAKVLVESVLIERDLLPLIEIRKSQ